MTKIKPKCFYKMEAAVNAQGFLLPCCWCDQPWTLEQEHFKPLVQDKFHLSKVKNINEVIYSDEWQIFKKDLQESNIKKLPPVCIKQCEEKEGKNKQSKIQRYIDRNSVRDEVR